MNPVSFAIATALIGLFGLIAPPSARSQAQTPELVPQVGSFSNNIAFSRDGTLMAQCNALWDMQTRRLIRIFPARGTAFGSDFCPDGRTLALCDEQGITLWDIDSGKSRPPLQPHRGKFDCIAYSPDGAKIAGGCEDGSLCLWDTRTGRLQAVLAASQAGAPAVAFAPDSGSIVTGGSLAGKGYVMIWSVAQNKRLRTISTNSQGIATVAVSPDGHMVAVGSEDKVSLWSADTGMLERTYPGTRRLAFSPDGRCLVIARPNSTDDLHGAVGLGDTIECLDARSGRTLWKRVEGYGMMGVTVSPDNALVLVSTFGPIIAFDMSDGHDLGDLTTYGFDAGRVQFRRGDPYLQTDKHTWNLRTAQEENTQDDLSPQERFLKAFPKPQRHGSEMTFYVTNVFSANGARLARVEIHSPLGPHPGLGYDEIALWDVASQTEIARIGKRPQPLNSPDAVDDVRFSQDARTLAVTTFSSGVVRCWGATDGHPLPSLQAPSGIVYSTAFRPDGHVLAGACEDGTIDLWEIGSGKLLKSTPAHSAGVNTVAFSPDGRYLWSGGDDGAVHLWDGGNLTRLADLTGHTAPVLSVNPSPDGRLLASADSQGIIKIWGLPDRTALETAIVIDGNNLCLVTPDGHYLTTRDAYRAIAFRVGRHAYPFEQFDLRLNRPDMVLHALGCPNQALIGAYHRAYLKRLDTLGFTEAQVSDERFHLPTLRLTGTAPPLTTAIRTLRFSISAADDAYPLDRLQVFVNDVPANFTCGGASGTGSRGLSLRGRNMESIVGTITLELGTGLNKIQVSALNSKGVESLRQTFNVACTVPAPKPDLYVLAVGVSRYQDGHNLASADKDAQAVADFFTGQSSRYAHVHILPLLNGDATREAILKTRAMLAQSRVDDEVVAFFAGHGLLDVDLNYYFATPDIDFAHPAARGLAYDGTQGIESLLDGIPARHKLLLMDTCHAGEVDKPATQLAGAAVPDPVDRGTQMVRASAAGLDNAFELQGELFADLRRGSGATVIAAARGVETAGETTAHGLFTQAVLDALTANPQIAVSALRDAVAARIDKETEGRQRPTARRENLEDDFSIVPAP